MMYIFSNYYRRVFMNHMKLVNHNPIGSSIFLKRENSRIDSCNRSSVCFFVFYICFFFVIRKSKNSISIKDYLSSSLQFSSKVV